MLRNACSKKTLVKGLHATDDCFQLVEQFQTQFTPITIISVSSSYGVHPLRMTTTSSSMLKVGFAVAEEANA